MAAFKVTADDLEGINKTTEHEANLKGLKRLGGAHKLVTALSSSDSNGLPPGGGTQQEVEDRIDVFGKNDMPTPDPKTWLELFIESFEDTTVLILCASAVVSFAVGVYDDRRKAAMGEPTDVPSWVEGVAITAAVLVVAVVTATNDYSKEAQFRALSAINDDILVKVIRGGLLAQISTKELLVGDVVQLEAGDKVPADGVYLHGTGAEANESALTGEPDDKVKSTEGDPFFLSGTELSAGQASMLVIAVGPSSQWGRMKAKLQKEEDETPLQEKLDTLANQIGYVGMGAAALTFVAMMISWYYTPESERTSSLFDEMLKAFIIGVTIVVVAVPEGLPLAVTISLAYSTMKMLADNNLIRVLAACETMGNATTICSDKTGTLTQNRMTVVKALLAGSLAEDPVQSLRALQSGAKEVVMMGMALNTTASLVEGNVVGNKTEGALLLLLQAAGEDPMAMRATGFNQDSDKIFPFSSTKKRMSVLVKAPGSSSKGSKLLLAKGAAEAMIALCTHQLDAKGKAQDMNAQDRARVLAQVSEWAKQSFRVIALAHKELGKADAEKDEDALHSGLCLAALVAIQDPLRPEVPEAVKTCQRAGITVRMVTGDNLDTAVAIAKECGILREGGLAMTGSDFRVMSPAQLDAVLPRLQVLARSSPEDKFLLVSRLNGGLPSGQAAWEEQHPGKSWATQRDLVLPGHREEWEAARHEGLGEVVGVTGDGTNDGPALRAAEVGLAMGISGTDVAKEASDIIIMDDNFSSIVKAVTWGRCVFDNIRKFLQFQLTVNIVALVTTFVSAVMGHEPPLNAVMMLWVNLIMDTMGALALGTELPTGKLLDRAPYKRNASLISRVMWRNVLIQAAYQLAGCLVLLEMGPELLALEKESRLHYTVVFNFFVFCQVFNEVNARSIGDEANVLKGLGSNPMFLAVLFFTVVSQIGIVEYGGDFTKTAPLTPELWARTVGLAFATMPLGILMRQVPVTESESDFALDSCGSIKITAKPPSKEAKAGKSGRRETRSSGKSKKKKNQ